jgi:hypothetical protein
MKRLVVFMFIVSLIAGAVSAQAIKEQSNPPPRNSRVREDNSVTVEGVLKLEKGFVAVENADKVYVVPMLNRYIGFINGLREGAKVSVEGYEFRNMIRPVKVTIEGKSYDFMSWSNRQTPEFGKRDSRPNNGRFAPTPYGNNRRNERRNSRRGCCR